MALAPPDDGAGHGPQCYRSPAPLATPPPMRYHAPMTASPERFRADEELPMARRRLAISIIYCVP